MQDGEERWHAIGLIDGWATATVVHAYRHEGLMKHPYHFRPPCADADERKHQSLSGFRFETLLPNGSQKCLQRTPAFGSPWSIRMRAMLAFLNQGTACDGLLSQRAESSGRQFPTSPAGTS